MAELWQAAWALRGCVTLALVGASLVCFSAVVAAQDQKGDGPGDSTRAMPGYLRVESALSGPEGAAFAGDFGYGFTESQEVQGGQSDGMHHRLQGSLAASVRPLRWLGVYLALSGRYDRHPDDDEGSDDGIAGTPRLGVRLGNEVAKGLALGFDASLYLPGGDAPSFDFSAASTDLVALATWMPGLEGFSVGLRAGFRVDNSNRSVDEPEQLRQGDFISLQASDFNAILVGLGASYRTGPLEFLLDSTWDVLVGEGAPPAGSSPLRIGGGLRYHVLDGLQIQANCEALASSRPAMGFDIPLVPIEPRLTAQVGLRYRLPFGKQKTEQEEKVKPEAPQPPPKPVELGSTAVIVRDELGQPVEGISGTLTLADGTTRELTIGEDSKIFVDRLPLGAATLSVSAEGYQEKTLELDIDGTETIQAELTLQPIKAQAQVRGLVRSFSGKPVAAEISIAPGDTVITTDEQGRFSVDMAPGRYTVDISAKGYRGQQRKVRVEPEGVTVLNVELRRAKGSSKRR